MNLTIRLKSERECIAQLEGYVKELFETFEVNQELYPNILISLTEAVNNAVRHGNLNDTEKAVIVEAMRQNSKVVCKISDEGKGFDYQHLPDPTKPENLQMEGGRGVFLMKQLSDNVIFRDSGSTVVIEFHI